MTLQSLNIHEKAKVLSLQTDKATALRLQALGMLPGTIVSVLQKKGRGTMVIDLRGTRFALGSSIASHIEVEHV